MYMETMMAAFVEGIDSFVKAAKRRMQEVMFWVVKDTYTAHVLIARMRRHLGSATSSRYDIVCYVGVSWKNYKIWNMHGEEGDNLPEETVQGPLSKTVANETLYQTVHETIGGTVQETVHELVSETV